MMKISQLTTIHEIPPKFTKIDPEHISSSRAVVSVRRSGLRVTSGATVSEPLRSSVVALEFGPKAVHAML